MSNLFEIGFIKLTQAGLPVHKILTHLDQIKPGRLDGSVDLQEGLAIFGLSAIGAYIRHVFRKEVKADSKTAKILYPFVGAFFAFTPMAGAALRD